MSEALSDELEVINSIYGDGTLAQSTEDDDTSIFILSLPEPGAGSGSDGLIPASRRPSLRLHFPSSYPDEPPHVLGTHRSGENAKRGDAARYLATFCAAVGSVFQPGMVCLFDAIEKTRELLARGQGQDQDHGSREGDVGTGTDDAAGAGDGGETGAGKGPAGLETRKGTGIKGGGGGRGGGGELDQEPPWITSDPLTELKSVFIARCAPVTSPAQAAGYVADLLARDKRVRSATHNISAWRIRGPNGTAFQDCDDDGETAAGGRLLHLMQLMDLWDVMVVVTRWYGGQKLGPRRFALINGAARDAFVRAGLVSEPAAGGRKKGHK